MMEKDPFSILGLPYGAPMTDVKKRYKEMANYYHPDKNPGDERAAEIMKNVNEAYTAIKSHDYYSEQHYYPERMTPAPPPAAQPQQQTNNYGPQYGGGAQAATTEAQQGGMPNGFYDQNGQYHYYDPNQGTSEANQQKAWQDAVYRDQEEQQQKLQKKQFIHTLLSRILPVVLAAIVLIVAFSILHNKHVQKGINNVVQGSTTTRQSLQIQLPENTDWNNWYLPE